ncbi:MULTISPECIES: UDP-N-acetylmuramoyl-tripeptide--D-alanyl-D-alanine ligase [unclassified Modestobacter]|uniref:UDP-N-acetylmuramoyl-tripeptide--D-alanyl-D- alanine ligase n=1 Tax=unclassified Modestobacter TaxID=2643866 RepID=UPI0022AAD134|nr:MULTISPECIES: UDP-N-acetylmuramoyl-tripeptide--D-alanyl-D-alanine ligase [unclassified Modestobacter]MCZ2824829.1 UDP-N-acetylmuramoyl-tripeptide--D-alanyl-D-alanine ligase [Modestobacter sp. VKM Ac-2981]MCZ2854668.1 UDP-N-acetylmuramoyl-tripeptide--D-alanyl-D-alanine ligase [Modestobacter sp. VKM Ac-2982]
MIALTLAEVAAAVDGDLVGDGSATVTGAVLVDSRAVAPGDLFVALPGERVDGADFLPAAAAAGAAGALTARADPALPCVVVADPVAALGRLAAAVHGRLVAAGLVTVGVTGSSGKTSTKDLLGQVLAAAGPTVSPQGSFNNDIGLPLTVLSADADTRFLVLEMGSRGPGHIARLCGIARPAIGVVLNVGSAHLGEFGSAEVIATSKGELVAALPASGTAVLNADDARVAGMAPRTQAAVLTTGLAEHADVRATDVELDDAARARFTLRARGEQHPVALQVVGVHQVANALSAAGAALAAGMAPAAVAQALSAAAPRSRWRMEVTTRADGVTVVNDAYNANPESMRAALAALRRLRGRRRIAVLGAMGELGPTAGAAHEELGRDAVRAGVDLVVSVGPDAAGVHAGARAELDARGRAGDRGGEQEESVHLPDRAAARRLLSEVVGPGDVVLVKASRSYGLEELAADLIADGGPEVTA